MKKGKIKDMNRPLADRIRPKTIKDVVGQEHILAKGKILDRALGSGHITNMIFYGPPGTGKTTLANIIAETSNKALHKLNATNASIKDIKEIIDSLDTFIAMDGVLLYLDEIQNFNKKQQQSLLEFIETGQITLIASTTENPYFSIYNAILSRSTILEFKPLKKSNIIKGLKRAIKIAEKDFVDAKIIYQEKILDYIADISNGDLRKAINSLELAIYTSNIKNDGNIHIDIEDAKECSQGKNINYNKSGDTYYDILSAFQKSIRGSDADAAIHYLARLIIVGDLLAICRRLLVIASEDIGLAYPSAISIVKSCVDAALQVGLPEARINLAQATILLASSPKSNSSIKAIDSAIKDIETKTTGDVPIHLKDSHYSGAKNLSRGLDYINPHDHFNNYVSQQYLPDNIKDSKYYIAGENKLEKQIKEYQKNIKNLK